MRVQKLPFRCHSFELACADLDIEHRLTKPRHPWTNGQVEPMNRMIREATVKRYYYETHDQLRHHLTDFVGAYNFARRLKTLRGLTPYEAIYKAWTDDPSRLISNPHHQSLGPNNKGVDDPYRVVYRHIVIDRCRQQQRLITSMTLDLRYFPKLHRSRRKWNPERRLWTIPVANWAS